MITTGALLHGQAERFLSFDTIEKPLVLQLGGDNPEELARCARLAEQFQYDEVNLNLGCPSEKVQQGSFGACLMGRPDVVADAVAAMNDATSLPVTVKTRIGIRHPENPDPATESYDHLANFVSRLAERGVNRFIIHARIAVLGGLSPKENRTVPPLQYELVHRLKKDFPRLKIEINGGFTSLETAREQLAHADGVMIGRAAQDHPRMFATADSQFYQSNDPGFSDDEILTAMMSYTEDQCRSGVPAHRILRHLLPLYHGQPGARRFKRALSENLSRYKDSPRALEIAINALKTAVLPA